MIDIAVALTGVTLLALLLLGTGALLAKVWPFSWPAGRDDQAQPDLLESLVKHRYVVTLRGGEGDFAGILTDQQIVATANGGTDLILVFEHCATMPTHEGDTTADIAGRVILGMSGIAYLQQVG